MRPTDCNPLPTHPGLCALAAGLLAMPGCTLGSVIETFVTGETGAGADVVFRAVLDPAVAGSAAVSVAVVEGRGLRLDGIEFESGSTDIVVVGAQRPGTPSDGALTRYNVRTGATLPSPIASTNAIVGAPPASLPSTVFPTAGGTYYVENQFGFADTGGPPAVHRIMFKPSGGGAEAVVFDGASCTLFFGSPCVNFEGLEIDSGGTLYTFAKDPDDPDKRALISVSLDSGTGLWDGAGLAKELAGLSADPSMQDGADELDIDESTGIMYGTNIVSGELIRMVGGVASIFIDPLAIAASAGNLGLLATRTDGIRADGDGHLVIASMSGLLLSVDIAGVLTDGADDSDVLVLYDAAVAGTGYAFDDLTSLSPVPVPGIQWLLVTGLIGFGWARSMDGMRCRVRSQLIARAGRVTTPYSTSLRPSRRLPVLLQSACRRIRFGW